MFLSAPYLEKKPSQMDNATYTQKLWEREATSPPPSPCQKKIMSNDEKDSFCPFPSIELSTSSLGPTACSYVKLSLDPEARLKGNE